MKRIKKRGLSPVIASVLLIMLTILLALIIFLWARGFITEQVEKFGQPIEELCKSVDFSVSRIQGEGDYDTLEIVNRGGTNINSFEIKLFKAGNSESNKFDLVLHPTESLSREIDLRMEDGTYPQKIEIFPILVGNVKGKTINRPYVCIDYGKTIQI